MTSTLINHIYYYYMSKENNMTYVYAMYAGNYVKIGITSSLDNRIKQVQTGCPLSIHRVKYIQVHSRNEALDIESSIHVAFNKHNTHGEWFIKDALSINKYSEIFKYCKIKEVCEPQIDKSLNALENLYKNISITNRDDKISAMVDLKNHIDNSYDDSFVYRSRDYVLSRVNKELKSMLRFSNKHNIVSDENYRKEKSMKKLRKNYPWMFKEEVAL